MNDATHRPTKHGAAPPPLPPTIPAGDGPACDSAANDRLRVHANSGGAPANSAASNPSAISFDPSQVFVRLRDDLRFYPERIDRRDVWIIEDPVASRYHRVGDAEYRLLAQLDGKTSLAAACRQAAYGSNGEGTVGQEIHSSAIDDAASLPEGAESADGVLDRRALPSANVVALLEWLMQSELVRPVRSVDGDRLARAAVARRAMRRAGSWNPLFVRIPLGSPDGWLTRIAPCFFACFSPAATVLALLAALVALLIVLTDSERFADSTRGILAPDNYVWMLAAWLGLKGLHEAAHAVCCKRYGGYVREVGVSLILFAPIPFVDVTSCWRFASKWRRIHVALAGMYAELAVASAAVFVWCATDRGPLNQFCAQLALMASVTTFLFNANPLMRFDGYYVLADWLELPNLASAGQRYVGQLARRWLLGIVPPKAGSPCSDRTLVRVYGVAAKLWSVVIWTSLSIAAAALFHGAGVAVVALMVALGAIRTLRRAAAGWARLGERRVAAAARLGVAAGALAIAAFVGLGSPWPGNCVAPGVVEYSPLTILRADTAGFIRSIEVRDGQFVRAGTPLATLENTALAGDLASLEADIAQSAVRCRTLRNRREMAEYQAEYDKLDSLRARLGQLQSRDERLTIRAPHDGRVLRRGLDAMLGAYLKSGDELCAIGGESQMEARLSIDQNDVDLAELRVGAPIRLRTPTGVVEARLSRIAPRAGTSPPHPALLAPHGGPLAVEQTPRHSREDDEGADDSFTLLQPRFEAVVALTAEQGRELASGQRCTASFRAPHLTVADVVVRSFGEWASRRWQPE